MIYELPCALEVSGKNIEINTDWRVAMDCIEALQDTELTDADKVTVLLGLLYKGEISPEDIAEAVKKAVWYLSGGAEENATGKKTPRLMDWQQDFRYIITPINRVAGCEVRSIPYMHWWTFLGYYAEIGDCTFAQIVRIRSLKAKGKKLDKADQQWYRENRDIVDIKTHYTDAETNALSAWGV